MRTANIKILGEDLSLFSITSEKDFPGCEGASVLLLPSLVADFKVFACTHRQNLSDPYSAMFASMAYLVEKRGLPLREITFETSRGNLEILRTGNGEYSFKLLECKHLCTNTIDVMGCEVEFLDVWCGAKFRIVHTDDVEVFRSEVLRELVRGGREIPSAVAAVGEVSRNSVVIPYTEYVKEKPSTAAMYMAVAYSEYVRAGKRMLAFSDECRSVSDYSSVTLFVKPNF